MSLVKVAAPLGGLLLTMVAAQGSAAAADQEEILDQIEARDKAAVSAYESGSFDKMKGALLKAIALGEKNGLGKDPIMARTYVLAGVLYVDGLEDRAAGLRYFAKALKISPDIKIPSGMGTSPVKAAFKQAVADNARGPEPEDAPAARSGSAKRDKSDDADERAALEAELDKKAATADRKRADVDVERRAEDAKRAEDEQRRAEVESKPREGETQRERRLREEKANLAQDLAMSKRAEGKERAERERVEGERDRLQKESSERDRQLESLKAKLQQAEGDKPAQERRAKEEKANLLQDIAMAKKNELRERGEKDRTQAEKDRLLKEGQDKDKQLADLRTRLAQLEQEKPERERVLADTKGRLQQTEKDKQDKEKQLADARARIAQLEKEKPERERLLSETKAKLQQTEKDKHDREKQLADTTTREKNEREAKEKLEKARQYAETEARERKTREDRERADRARLADGPELPARVPEPLYCAVPDEAEAGVDLFVHCIPRPDLRAKAVAFYYRSSDSIHYNAAILERSPKGWYTTMIPASKVRGKLIQYYGEVLDTREAVVASNGKATSPNVLTLHGSTAKVARGATGGKLQQARETGR